MSNEIEKKERPAPLAALSSGVLIGRTLEEQWRMAVMYHASGILPKAFNSPEKVMVGFQVCYELGLKPITALRQIAIINGAPSLFGDLPLAIVRASGELGGMDEFFLDKDGERISMENGNLFADPVAAVCKVHRKGDPKAREVVFSVQDAKIAGIFGQGVWKSYPKRMLMMRPRSQVLKDVFPDVLHGMTIGEYDHNLVLEAVPDSGDAPQAARAGKASSKLNELLDVDPAPAEPVSAPEEAQPTPPASVFDEPEPARTETPPAVVKADPVAAVAKAIERMKKTQPASGIEAFDFNGPSTL